jgi:hypothetical protein
MPTFRCFGLTADNRIIWGRHIVAADVATAIVLGTQVAPDRTRRIEVWLGSRKLYPDPVAANTNDSLKPARHR